MNRVSCGHFASRCSSRLSLHPGRRSVTAETRTTKVNTGRRMRRTVAMNIPIPTCTCALESLDSCGECNG